MAYTKAQWDKLQSAVPRDERVSYADYLATLTGLERIKALEAASGLPITAIIDEQAKAAGSAADTAAQKTATAANASAAAIQAAAAKLGRGEPLTAEESALVGIKVTTAPVKTGFTPAELQAIVAKLGRGEPLTAEEAAAINAPATPSIVTTAGPGVVTTVGPVLTTVGPVLTTVGPTLTTVGPSLTTVGPVLTTAGPTLTTAGPTLTTAGPTLTTKPPIVTTTPAPGSATDAAARAERQSAYDLLYTQFAQYGLASLVEPLKGLIESGASPAEFALRLRNDSSINPATGRPWNEAYKKRFSANDLRISKGLKAISEAEYLGLEDQYQNILRNAGLPESYWKRGDLGVQEGFTNFIANDVSAVELEDRVSTAQQRVLYANPEVSIALKTFYPDISNGDLLAYALDPTKGLEQIKRRITAAEIGSSAVQLGLATNVTDAEYLARYGVNKAQAQQGYRTAAEILPTASKLGDIYSRQGLGPYTQQTAEQEIFNVPGAAEAAAKRRKLTELEQASFSGKAGMGALARDRAGAF